MTPASKYLYGVRKYEDEAWYADMTYREFMSRYNAQSKPKLIKYWSEVGYRANDLQGVE